jgi:hypothetical protein
MPFQKHAFISYTHIDNQKLEGQLLGWVTRFHNTLNAQLEMRLGERVDIWRDDKLTGNDNFGIEIIDRLKNVALFILVMSPRYLKSEWCVKEINEFCNVAAASAGISIANKSRIFRVEKLPVKSLETLPEALQQNIGFPFYKSQNNVAVEIDPAYGEDMSGPFNLSVAILAQNIADTIEAIRSAELDETTRKAEQAKGAAKRAVYLAETGWDRDLDRKQFEMDLRSHGYDVFPDKSLPSRERECRDEIGRLLAQCELSIHLIGNYPGMKPSGPEKPKSIDELQNEIAAEQAGSRGLRRIVWVPSDLHPTDDDHKAFIQALHGDSRAQFGADLIDGDFASVKDAAIAALRTPSGPSKEEEQIPDNLIYIVCDRRDSGQTVELRKWLRARGLDPQRPLFEGDASTVRKENDRLMNQSKAVIIFYGAGDEAWCRAVTKELDRVKRRTPIWTYVAPNDSAHKRELIDEFADGPVLSGLNGLPEADLSRFLQAIGGGQ